MVEYRFPDATAVKHGISNVGISPIAKTESGKAKELFRREILASDFPCVIRKQATEEVLANSREAETSPKRNEVISEILWATLRVDRLYHENSSRLVDWTMEEVIQILRRSAEWWDQNSPDLRDPEIIKSQFAGDQLRKELSNWFHCLPT